MKKLLAGICSILFLHSFSSAKEFVSDSQKTSGQKNLIKAIAVMVNTEGNKKAPARTTHVFSSDCPL
ncbi:MAG: hypothetical protein ACJ749_11225 [Flavisolibacter sp.]